MFPLIETAIARVPGVRSVAPVRLFTRAARGRNWVAVAEDSTGRGRINLQPWQLPELAMLSVGVGSTASSTLPPGGRGLEGDDGVAIPVVPEMC